MERTGRRWALALFAFLVVGCVYERSSIRPGRYQSADGVTTLCVNPDGSCAAVTRETESQVLRRYYGSLQDAASTVVLTEFCDSLSGSRLRAPQTSLHLLPSIQPNDPGVVLYVFHGELIVFVDKTRPCVQQVASASRPSRYPTYVYPPESIRPLVTHSVSFECDRVELDGEALGLDQFKASLVGFAGSGGWHRFRVETGLECCPEEEPYWDHLSGMIRSEENLLHLTS